MAKRPSPADLEAVLRQRIREETKNGMSLAQLATLAGITSGQLSRFDRGERSLTLGTASRLCEVLGLGLVDTNHKKDVRK